MKFEDVKEARQFLESEFEEHVPSSGASETAYGESLRAINRIGYRYYNDGDHVNMGYGKETTNMAVRYLLDNLEGDTKDHLEGMFDKPYDSYDDKSYEDKLEKLFIGTANYLDEHKQELLEKPAVDMFDYVDSKYDQDDTYDDEDNMEWEEDDYEDDEGYEM